MFHPRVKYQAHPWLPPFFCLNYLVTKHFRSYIHKISCIHLLPLVLGLQYCSPGLLSLGLSFPCPPPTPKLTTKEGLFWSCHSPSQNHPRLPHSVGIMLTSYLSLWAPVKHQCPNHLRSYFSIFLYCGFLCTFPLLLSILLKYNIHTEKYSSNKILWMFFQEVQPEPRSRNRLAESQKTLQEPSPVTAPAKRNCYPDI